MERQTSVCEPDVRLQLIQRRDGSSLTDQRQKFHPEKLPAFASTPPTGPHRGGAPLYTPLGVQTLGITFVSLAEGIDATTPAGKLQMHILGAIAEFERGIVERVKAGLERARAQGRRLGRPRSTPSKLEVPGGSVREAAQVWGVSKSTAARWISAGRSPVASGDVSPD
jgi:hypothetical protein